jgi:hypothetical protein
MINFESYKGLFARVHMYMHLHIYRYLFVWKVDFETHSSFICLQEFT